MTFGSFSDLFCRRLSELCDRERLSFRRLSEELGHSHSYWDDRYNHPSRIYVKDLIELCTYFHVPISYFLDDEQVERNTYLEEFKQLTSRLDPSETEMALHLIAHYIERKELNESSQGRAEGPKTGERSAVRSEEDAFSGR